ncbi:hypothetical protein IG631_17371 [Alternaria alternata]|nr:hypothetical protein IG631_17371 [Alternaria alternata]
MPPKRSSACRGNDCRSSSANDPRLSKTALMLRTNFLRRRPFEPYTARHTSQSSLLREVASRTFSYLSMYTCKSDLHVQRCSSLSGAYEVWGLAGYIVVLD